MYTYMYKYTSNSIQETSTSCFSFVFSALVSLSCYNNIPKTEWLINNRNLFLTVLEAESLISEW